MNNVNFIGQVSGAQGCAVSLILSQNGNAVWIHHYYDSFFNTSQLTPGNYNLMITGYTQGTFVLNIQGASNINPPVPANYQQSISGSFTFQVP